MRRIGASSIENESSVVVSGNLTGERLHEISPFSYSSRAHIPRNHRICGFSAGHVFDRRVRSGDEGAGGGGAVEILQRWGRRALGTRGGGGGGHTGAGETERWAPRPGGGGKGQVGT